jgi:DNA/RNA endonuclease YhcR with UshA esterase domain
MKHIYLLLAVLLYGGVMNAQTAIKPEEVSRHIDDSVTVCGKVDDMRYFESSKNSPTFLNIGGNFPNQLLTVVIWGDVRKEFKTNVDDLKGKQVCITGRIILYKERPEIVIGQPSQIVIQ